MLLQDWLEKLNNAENAHYARRVEQNKASKLLSVVKDKVESEILKNTTEEQEYKEIAEITIKIMHELQAVIEEWEYEG